MVRLPLLIIGYANLYLPANKNTEESKHLILFTHGGGWTDGSKEDGEIYCKYLASKGYVAASINYTLFDEKHKTSVPQIKEEMILSVQAIKNEAERQGYILKDMANFGFSAGACQSLFFAFAQKEAADLKVRFVIDLSGPVSFNPDFWTKEAGAFWYVEKTLGLNGSLESKASFVSKYICHSQLLLQTLEKNQVPYKCIEFPNSGHALACDLDKAKELKRYIDIYCEKYFSDIL